MAISILTRRARNNDDSEFTDKELAVLEYVFGIIEIYGWYNETKSYNY